VLACIHPDPRRISKAHLRVFVCGVYCVFVSSLPKICLQIFVLDFAKRMTLHFPFMPSVFRYMTGRLQFVWQLMPTIGLFNSLKQWQNPDSLNRMAERDIQNGWQKFIQFLFIFLAWTFIFCPLMVYPLQVIIFCGDG
jgi:hypothetical protein